MKHLETRDLIAGLLLAALGLFVATYASSHYTIGNAARMGPGFFPMVLGWVLVGLGLLIALLAFRKTVQVLHPPKFVLRSLVAVPAAVLVFGLLVERLGLVPATYALTFIAVAAERPYRWQRTATLATCLALMAWLIFSVALNMTLPAFAFLG